MPDQHKVTIEFETIPVTGEVIKAAYSDMTIVRIHLTTSKRFYKPIWKYVLLKDPKFVEYLVGQLCGYIENNWSNIVQTSQAFKASRTTPPPLSVHPRIIHIAIGKNFYVSCGYNEPIPIGQNPTELTYLCGLPISEY